MNKYSYLLLLISLQTSTCLTNHLIGQESLTPAKEASAYIAGVSPFVLDPGQVEGALTSSLTSYWNIFSGYNRIGDFYSNIYRLSIADNVLNVAYGFSNKGNWDLGAELHYTFRRFDDEARNSPFDVYDSEAPSFKGLSYLGLRARAAPFADIPNWTFQASILFPNGDKDLRNNLGAQRTQFSLQTTFYKSINYQVGYFLQGGWGFYFPSSQTNESLVNAINASAYLSFNAWSNRIYLLPGLAYSGSYHSDLSELAQGVFGVGVIQFQTGAMFSINIQHSLPLLFESHQPQVAFERNSFSSTALGIRFLFQ
ncbi:MAG: hypothetical protein OEQ53_13770 [Saprospiraceae bacterium]|nr:hypothetical protein [Saprospiraceae bacterium]